MFIQEQRLVLVTLGISGLALIVSFFNISVLPFDAAWLAVIVSGIPIIRGAGLALLKEFDIKADVLVAIALVASVIIGEVFAAGEVAFIMALGAYLEDRTVAKARTGIEKLVDLTPTTARLLTNNGHEQIIPADQVKVGERLRVLAGESIAVDGVIVHGVTAVDQSLMTGESLPVDKAVGDQVLSGTINQLGPFEMIAAKVGADSSVQRMVRLVESADASKAKIVGTADRWATWIVLAALVVAILTWIVTGEIIRAVTVLVVFCPCALVLATPTAIMAGIGNAAKHGVLVSQGDALERLAQARYIAFDKTGTLTYGQPSVVGLVNCGMSTDAEFLQLVAATQLQSEHPLGKAIVLHYQQNYQQPPYAAEKFLLLPGRGVTALVNDRNIWAGNQALLTEQAVALPPQFMADIEALQTDGRTIIYVMDEYCLLGAIALADTIRDDAAAMIQAIHAAGISTLLLTGDSDQAAAPIVARTKIKAVAANCLPEDKLRVIQQHQNSGQAICMVGDGINDAPALKAAQVGIAMGGIGSDIAVDAADMVLVGDNISIMPQLVLLAKEVMRTIKFNIAAALIINFIAIVLAVTGILNPTIGALVHNAGSIAVIINSALLLNWHHGAKLNPPRTS